MSKSLKYLVAASLPQIVLGEKGVSYTYEPQTRYMLIAYGCFAGFFLLWRASSVLMQYIRLRQTVKGSPHVAFTQKSSVSAFLKKHVFYAPLFHLRKHRYLRWGPRLNFGTLPTRVDVLCMMVILAINLAVLFSGLDYKMGAYNIAYKVRNRAGAVATVNLIPMFIMASRNSPLIVMLDIPFDTFNLMHRWLGRIVGSEIVIHCLAWVVGAAAKGQFNQFPGDFRQAFWYTGLIAGSPMILMIMLAWSPIRRAFYDVFLRVHQFLALAIVIAASYHIRIDNFFEFNILWGACALWGAEHVFRWLRVLYRNISLKGTSKAVIEVLPGDAVRVTVDLARPWKFKAGEHAYIYLPGIYPLAAHPFSVAWAGPTIISSSQVELKDEAAVVTTQRDMGELQTQSIQFVARLRGRFTNTLWTRASLSEDGRITANCFVEGPYRGSQNDLRSYGTALLFAGGVGITHQIPFLRELVEGYAQGGKVASRRVYLTWIVHESAHIEWAASWLSHIMSMEGARELLHVKIHVTRATSSHSEEMKNREVASMIDQGVEVVTSKPSVSAVLDEELRTKVGAVAVSVCGPGELSDAVRLAVRERQHSANIDFYEEAFSW